MRYRSGDRVEVVWGERLEALVGGRNLIDPALFYRELSRIIESADLTSHRGWEHVIQDATLTGKQGSQSVYRTICLARTTQWAVGQGGFWTTSGMHATSLFRRSFELVYDCGSSTHGGLDLALKAYRPTDEKIDYLFVSHLDVDHTSGLDQLLKSYAVNMVIMPLLSPAATLLAAARFAAQDALQDPVVNLLTDPGVYLSERGVRRVILVQPAPEDRKDEPPISPEPGDLPDERRSNAGGGQQDIIVQAPLGSPLPVPFPKAQVVPYATTFWLVGKDGRAFWQLSPYVHPFEPLRIGRFMQSAYTLLDDAGASAGGAAAYAGLKSILSSSKGRSDLKRLFKLVRQDHNSVSMSLYSSPFPSSGGHGRLDIEVTNIKVTDAGGHARSMRPTPERIGWMQTGDSTLARDSYRRAWIAHYAKLLPRVGVLVLPHHGSKHNFHKELLSTTVPTLALACASKTNQYGHPSAAIARSMKSTTSVYHQVDEDPQTQVTGYYVSASA